MPGPGQVVVVGASLAGLRAVESLRREGYAGRIVVVGEEPHMPYDRPPLSKQFLKGDWDEDKITLRRQGFDDLEVEWRLGERAVALDTRARRVRVSGGSADDEIPYDTAMIATGGEARTLRGQPDLEGIHVLRTLAHASALRADLERSPRVVVVGAGFIGMETAATCRARGLEVCVVEPLATPLMRGLGSRLGEFVASRHRDEGVELRCGVGVTGFVGEGRVEAVRLGDETTLPADVVVVGVGARPATEWLEDSGLAIDDGVLCDSVGRTSAPDVYAIGDAARWQNPLAGDAHVRYEHWTSAVEQGTHAAEHLVKGDEVGAHAVVPYVWSDQFDLRIAIAGEVGEEDDMEICHGSLEEGRFLALFGRKGRLVGAVGSRRPRPLLAARRRIGEGMSWEKALEENRES